MLPSSSSSSLPGSHHFQQHPRRRSSSLRRAANAADGSNSSSSSFGGLLTLEVTFLDNTTKAFSLFRGGTAGDLVRVIVERLGLVPGNEEDLLPFFGLVESYTGPSAGWVRKQAGSEGGATTSSTPLKFPSSICRHHPRPSRQQGRAARGAPRPNRPRSPRPQPELSEQPAEQAGLPAPRSGLPLPSATFAAGFGIALPPV